MPDSPTPDIEDGQSDQRQPDEESSGMIPPPVTDDTLTLSDGRLLAYAEYGPSDGDPLVFFHGTPGSRYTRHPDASILEKHSVRQVTLERPGYGQTTNQPRRELLDWPHDVREAADALGFDQFAVAGFSGGGPHALACAACLPDRVTSAAVINGLGPLKAPGATDGMEWQNRLALRLAGLPVIPTLMVWPIVRKIRKDVDAAIDAFGDRFADVDARIIQRPEVRGMFKEDFSEAVQQGTKGYVRDGRIFSRSWGFELGDISVPIELWHGDLDTNVPMSMARYVADELRSCSAHLYSDEGHLLIIDHWDDILSRLTESGAT